MRIKLENLLARVITLILGQSFFTKTPLSSLLSSSSSSSPTRRILVLCSGNICRSPYAERRLRERLGPSFEVISRGLETTPGKPADPAAVAAAKERGCDLSTHRTESVTPAELEASPLILVMDRSHRERLKVHGPGVLAKTAYLGAFGMQEGGPLLIADPFGRTAEVFRVCYDEIDRAVEGLVRAIERGAA